MRDLLSHCPQPPDFALDWEALLREYAFVQALAACPQDPEHHAEGDVAIHTRMVCEALLSHRDFARLSATDRAVLFAAAVLHDVAKPACTVEVDSAQRSGAPSIDSAQRSGAPSIGGRLRAPHHAPRGAVMARGILWRMGVPFALREQITALVQHHQMPFYCIDQADPRRSAITAAETARCDLLALLAESDARGRICRDQPRILDQVALFAALCEDHGLLRGRHRFASDHSRFVYFRTPGRDPDYPAHDDTTGEVILMSGLPGSGKSHHIARHFGDLPLVSLDALRDELDIDPGDNQGAVIDRARGLMREHLRRGERFVWNATSLTRKLRGRCVDLAAAYRARVRIVYVEVPSRVQEQQNAGREARVPAAVVGRMLDQWQVPDTTEAHQLEYIVRDAT